MFGDLEWLRLRVRGQSFILHQIRKMIGMVIAIMRTGADEKRAIPLSLGPERRSVPRAPGTGLFLRQINYDSYNRRLVSIKAGHDALDWDALQVRDREKDGVSRGGVSNNGNVRLMRHAGQDRRVHADDDLPGHGGGGAQLCVRPCRPSLIASSVLADLFSLSARPGNRGLQVPGLYPERGLLQAGHAVHLGHESRARRPGRHPYPNPRRGCHTRRRGTRVCTEGIERA